MLDKISITTPIQEWMVFQHQDGFAEINLAGNFSLSDSGNYPVLRVVNTKTQKTVIYERINVKIGDSVWNKKISLHIGCYRIETGIALQNASHDPRYLARGQIVNNIFIGEVFIIAGQSNAVGYGYATSDICDMPRYGVNCLRQDWMIASHPLSHFNNDGPTSDFLNTGHSPWLKLGKLVYDNTNIPVGIVPTALNGTNIDLWAEGQKLFENMILKAKQTKANNFVWYQGCSDVFEGKYNDYEKKLSNFIEAIKKHLGQGINIYIIQISGTTNKENPDIGWRVVREAQRKIAAQQKAFLITSYDLINYSDDIHLGCQDNITLAERVFKCYTGKKPCKDIKVSIKNDCQISLEGLPVHQDTLKNIVVFDKDNNKVPCKISIAKNKVILTPQNTALACYISLSFGRLYNGNPILTPQGDIYPYFYLKL